MRTLRVKLTISESGEHGAARAAFDEIAERHSDQAVFQVNETRYVDEDDWGFKLTYRANSDFCQSTSLREIDRAMAQVAPNSFERRFDADEDG